MSRWATLMYKPQTESTYSTRLLSEVLMASLGSFDLQIFIISEVKVGILFIEKRKRIRDKVQTVPISVLEAVVWVVLCRYAKNNRGNQLILDCSHYAYIVDKMFGEQKEKIYVEIRENNVAKKGSQNAWIPNQLSDQRGS